MWLGILLDAVIIFFVVWIFLREQSPEFINIVYVSVGLTAVNFVLGLALVPTIGLWVVIPMGIVAFLAFAFFCQLPVRNAAIAAVLYMAIKIGISYLFIMMK